MGNNSRTERLIVGSAAILCFALLCASCSPKYRPVLTKIVDADVVGTWYLAKDSAQRLKWEGEINDTQAQECFLTFKPSGECQFHSYSVAARKFTDIACHWQLDHEVMSQSGRSTPNVVRISLPMNAKQEIELLFLGETSTRLVLYENLNNGWGDNIVIAYTRK
jgi:hypothetical protein